MKLKPNRWHWFWDRDGKGYVPGETELQEVTTDTRGLDSNYAVLVRTDKDCNILQPEPGPWHPCHWVLGEPQKP